MQRKDQPNLAVTTPFYFPLPNGRYEVKPGLFKFPYGFGNPLVDEKVFQIDALASTYREEKLRARRERLEKYYCSHNFSETAARAINQFIIDALIEQYPQFFQLTKRKDRFLLYCALTKETLNCDRQFRLLETALGNKLTPAYRDTFDALACQIQEDLSVVSLDRHGDDYVAALHLCLPNHWAATDKIGQQFISVHEPVPHMEEINSHAQQLSHAMLHKSPFVRFAWGLATDTRLNHHPVAPTDVAPRRWQGRRFNPAQAELYLRVERQTIHGFPAASCVLFTIRTYFYDVHTLAQVPEQRSQLLSAIRSMSGNSLDYKGLKDDKAAIIAWLENMVTGDW